MNRKRLIFVLGIFLILFIIASVVAFRFTTTNLSGRGKFDFGTSVTNATSTSFTQRFISGMQPVARYTTASFSGRFGILDDATALILSINMTYPNHLQEIVRGSDNETGEDDLSHVPDTINLTAKVFDGSNSGVSGANCFFYDGNLFLGNRTTNSSGDCYVEYNKTNYNSTLRNLKVNYTSSSGTINVSEDNNNISLTRYVAVLTMENLRSNGRYYDGDSAVLSIKIRKSNATSSDLLYTPVNVSAHAKNSAGASRGLNYYPGNINLLSVGNFTTNVTVTYGAGANAFIKWEVNYSDDGYVTYIGSALHADEDVCQGDFGNFSEWSECSGGTQTRSRTDSSSCTEVETQSCSSGGGGGGGEECTNECSFGNIQDSCSGNSVQSRTCGNFDSDGCFEWGSWSVTEQCSSGEVCQNAECFVTCQESWSCSSWSSCSGGVQTRTCSDLNSCGTTNNAPATSRSCNIPVELPDVVELPDGTMCVTNFVCEDWGSCEATYGFSDVLEGKTSVLGFQSRTCVDRNQCTIEKIQTQECDFRVPVVATRTKWCYQDYVEIHDIYEGQLLGRLKEEKISDSLAIKKFEAFFTGVIGSNFTGYCSYCYDGVKNYDEAGIDCGGSGCPSCKSIVSFFNWLPILIWILWILLLLGIAAEVVVERRNVARISDRLTFGIGDKILKESRREKEIEREIVGEFRKLGFGFKLPKLHLPEVSEPEFKLVRPKASDHEILHLEKLKREIHEIKLKTNLRGEKSVEKLKEIERHLAAKEKVLASVISTKIGKKVREYESGPEFKFEAGIYKPRESLLSKLRRKLRIWKREGYYGTAHLEKKIESYELEMKDKFGREKSRLGRFVTNYRRNRDLARREKELRKVAEEKEKVRIRLEEKRKENLERQKELLRKDLREHRIAVAKEVSRREKENARNARRKTKRMVHEGISRMRHEEKIKRIQKQERKKEIHRKISVLKGELRRRKLSNLMNKLRIWKREGYYGTAALENEIKRLKEQK